VTLDVPFAHARWRTVPPLAAAGAIETVLALLGHWPTAFALGVALASIGVAGGLQFSAELRLRTLAPLPMIAGFLVLAAGVASSPAPELLAGVGAVALLAWIAEDATRPAGGWIRGAIGWGLPGLAVGLAWVSSFLLPPATAPIGVAGGLLAAIVIALAALFHRPELVTSDPTSTL
jgi:hypothetical protein